MLSNIDVLTYPSVPRPTIVLKLEAAFEAVTVDRLEVFTYCKVLKEGARLLIVEALCVTVLIACPMDVDSVATLTYPSVPRFAV